MRQRNIKNLDEKLHTYDKYRVYEPNLCRGSWKEVFKNDNPIYLEIGCGKGKFITDMARNDIGSNYIAVEGQKSVVLRAFEKAEAANLSNIKITVGYVDDIGEYFEPGELSGIYLNFSDPWPKGRHFKRRLTYYKRLLSYINALAPKGFIEFKTDNDGLFEFTLEQIEEAGLIVEEMTTDLHSSAFKSKNITTEYEERFIDRGKNINYVKIRAI